jgi:hypothetical protein
VAVSTTTKALRQIKSGDTGGEMETKSALILSFTLYKVAGLAVGVVFLYFGYRLFMAGLWGSAGDVEAQFRDTKVLVRQAAPGTFFALFGAAIILMTLFQGFDFYYTAQEDALSTTKPDMP